MPGPGVEIKAEGHHSQSSHCGAGCHTDAESKIKMMVRGELEIKNLVFANIKKLVFTKSNSWDSVS
jgi:hypothetical protein